MITPSNPSKPFSFLGLAAALATGMLASVSVANAQASFAILYSFTGQITDGYLPEAGLMQDPDGTLFGTTQYGGTSGRGTVFQMAPDGSGYAVLHSFTGSPTDGQNPYAGLIQGPDGTLYGTTLAGGTSDSDCPSGCGTVFQMAPDGSGYTVLHSFTGSDGDNPYGGLIQGPDGTLFGTTQYGGTSECTIGCGTVFQMAPDGSGFNVLHNFAGRPADGALPEAGLIQGPDGTLYGTTIFGGTTDRGTIFQMAPDGSGFTVLHSFTGSLTDGSGPLAALMQGPDGTLYGTTFQGGTRNLGTIFQMAPDGSGFTVLHSFTGSPTDGRQSFGRLTQGPDGTLYGMTRFGGTNDFGTIFQIAPDGSGYAILHSFTGSPTDGRSPFAGLIPGLDGTLFGTTYGGGTSNLGVVFQLTLSPSAPTSGRVGHK